MKVCTVVKKEGDGLRVEESSVVSDDHEFGWQGDELHIEGQILRPSSGDETGDA